MIHTIKLKQTDKYHAIFLLTIERKRPFEINKYILSTFDNINILV